MENRYREDTIVQNLFTNKMDWKATYSHYNTWLANTEKKKSTKTADKLKLREEKEFERKCLSHTDLASFHLFFLKLSVKQHKRGRFIAQLAQVRYEVLRALIMKTAIFRNMSPHSLVELYRRFI